ncbi:MAG TPA: hypothetical protein VKU19_35390 [Bryobacteraceae bacterium]|nr:hypothetical protein [Bryobacteraceae bacterium]
MRTFEQFLSENVAHGGVNIVFEAGMFALINKLEIIAKALREAGVEFEVVGGMAVNAHIARSHRSETFLTRDVDLLADRNDLSRITEAVKSIGYEAKKIMGGYALMRPGEGLGEGIHLLFVGEKSKSTQPLPHPPLRPETKELFGITIPVAPLQDLIQMKLNSFRPKDVVHLEILDDVGLISSEIEASLPALLLDRLRDARRQHAEGKPDVEG